MRSRHACGVLFLILFVLFEFRVAAQADHSMHTASRATDTTNSLVIQILKDMAKQAEEIKKNGDVVIGGPDLPIPPQSPGDDYWSGMLQVTQLNNPLISEECRHRAVEIAKDTIGGPGEALRHTTEHIVEWEEVLEGDRKMSISQYLEHMVRCREFCGPLIGSLIKCHIDSIQNSPSVIIMFDAGSPGESERFRFSMADAEAIRSFAQRMLSEGREILLESRASILNSREELPYNLSLSRRRADLVKEALVSAGFPPGEILIKSLCWEPPRLAISEISDVYGFRDLRSGLSNPQFMDQSVVLVGYNKLEK